MRKILFLSILGLAAMTASAQITYDFATVDVPGSTFTRIHDINRASDMVGQFHDTRRIGHAFLLRAGKF